MTKDPIIAEIHAVRARMLQECGGDMDKLIARVHRNAQRLGVKAVRLTPKRNQKPAAASSKSRSAR